MASLALPTLVGLIVLALAFDFLNGLHDAANAIATVVSTRVLRPLTAVFWAAFFNFIALGVFGLHVAQTLGTGIIDPGAVDSGVIFGALVGAIVWNVTSWLLAFPTSSSHALIGGLLGAGVAHAGLSAVVWSGVIKTAFGIVLAPLCGFAVAVGLVIAVSWLPALPPPAACVRSTLLARARRHHRYRFRAPALGGPLGRGRRYRDRVAGDHARRCSGRSPFLSSHAPGGIRVRGGEAVPRSKARSPCHPKHRQHRVLRPWVPAGYDVRWTGFACPEVPEQVSSRGHLYHLGNR